jgi:hypothetical protein
MNIISGSEENEERFRRRSKGSEISGKSTKEVYEKSTSYEYSEQRQGNGRKPYLIVTVMDKKYFYYFIYVNNTIQEIRKIVLYFVTEIFFMNFC